MYAERVPLGPYKTAVLRFQICFPDAYPVLPPLVTFSTDLFHPLIAPLTTFMYTTDIQDNGTVSATDAERLPPGGFSLRHGFPEWFGRKSRMGQEAEPPASKVSSPKSDASSGYMSTSKRSIAVYDVLKYIRSTFTEDKVLDDIPLAAAGNPGAWHAWRAHKRKPGKIREPAEDSREIQESAAAATPAADADADVNTDADAAASDNADDTNAEAKDNETANTDATNTSAIGASDNTSLKQPGEWNWEGVWEDRVKKGIAMSLSEPVLYGGSTPTEELVSQHNMPSPEKGLQPLIAYRCIDSISST